MPRNDKLYRTNQSNQVCYGKPDEKQYSQKTIKIHYNSSFFKNIKG